MPIDPVKRIAEWNAKYNTERIKAMLDDMRPNMLANVTAVFPLIASMEQQVKQVLDSSGVDTTDYPGYLAFGRQVWALTRKDVSGESLALAVAIQIAKWVARGYTQAVLQAIRSEVFNVGAPIAP
jgi:hypothetical protein